jgi:hypothetical protein
MNPRILIVLLYLIWAIPINAQTFTSGVPVYDTIKRDSFTTQSTYASLCPSSTVLFDSTAANRVSGVSYYLKITGSALMKDSLRAISRIHADLGPVNVGDSFLLTNNAAIFEGSYYTLRFGSRWTSGEFYYVIMAVGTPTKAGQPYVCKADIGRQASGSVDFCSPNFTNIYTTIKIACSIGGVTTAIVQPSIYPDSEFRVYPSPASKVLILDYSLRQAARFVITDQYGRDVQTAVMSAGPQLLQLSTTHLTPGIYSYRVIVNNLTLKVGRFSVLQ